MAVLAWALAVMATAQAAPAVTAELSLQPKAATVLVSDTLTVNIIVSDVVDLYGAELTLAFDPGIASVVDDNPGRAGVQIGPGSCPQADFEAANSVDNGAGIINYAVTSLAPAAPCSGNGTVASITFQGLSTGTTPISFSTWLLSDASIQTIPATASDGSLTVQPRPGLLQGAIALQGRSDHSGVALAVRTAAGPVSDTVSGSSGAFAFSLVPAAYTLTVEMAGYLDAVQPGLVIAADGLIDLPPLTLPCGDPNDDDLVNILDLTLIGSHYKLICGDPGWDGRADMINDCTVNILDLTCAGANYGRSSPVGWP
jgi:hypothetical protein